MSSRFASTHSVNSISVALSPAVKTPLQCPVMLAFSMSNSQRLHVSMAVTVNVVAMPPFAYSTKRLSSRISVPLKSLRQE